MKIVHSYWSPETPAQTQPTLDGRVTCDVVVVGAGVNGLSSAYHLAKAGADVVLLDRGAVGAQSSTKNFGVMTSLWLYKGYPLEKRRILARYGERALERVREMIEREGIDCDLQRSHHCLVARSKASRKQVWNNALELKSLGYDSRFVEPEDVDVTLFQSFGANYVRQYELDPYRFIEGFKQAALRAGVRIYEGSGATKVADGSPTEVTTERGSVVARTAVITANGFTGSMGLDTTNLSIPVQIFALATKPLAPQVAESVARLHGADANATDMGARTDAERLHWQRLRADGTLLFGGGGRVATTDILNPRPTAEKARSLVAELRRRYPLISEDDVLFFWGGTISAPAGEKPTVSRLPGTRSIIIVQCCYGHGMGLGANIGELVREVIEPGSLNDPDGLAYLRYCGIGASVASRLEGAAMRIVNKGPLRGALNKVLGAD